VTDGGPVTGANVVFVRSEPVVPGNIGGPEAADALCNASAAAAGLDGQFVAWIGGRDSGSVVAGTPGWVRTDGRVWVETTAALLSVTGPMYYPPRLDENGSDVGAAPLVTALDALGQPLAENCGDWTDPLSPNAFRVGWSDGGIEAWTDGSPWSCDDPAHLLCLQIDGPDAVSLQTQTGRLAFVAPNVHAAPGGIVSADAACQLAAADEGLTGSYLALIADGNASPISRFDTGGDPWVRADGVAVIDDPSRFASPIANPDGWFTAPLETAANGVHIPGLRVWTGADTPRDGSMDACGGWLIAGDESVGAITSYSAEGWFGVFTANCDTAYGLYCLEG
jgi:hypothetical protein